MMVTKEVIVKWNLNPKYRDHYILKGYFFTKVLDEFSVNVFDLPDNSHAIVDVKCDYCPKKIKMTYQTYVNRRNKNIIKKDCCQSCIGRKNEEVSMKKYGVSSTNKIKEIKEKQAEKRRLNKDFVEKFLLEKGYKLIGEYINVDTPLDFICEKHEDKGVQKSRYGDIKVGKGGCRICANEKISKARKGSNNFFWEGGITNISSHFRNNSPTILEWKKESMEKCGYKCVVTGDNFDDIHHLYSFNKILRETLKTLGIKDVKKINDYSEEEFEKIEVAFKEIHSKYGLGVCLKKDIHKEFHNIYGNRDNTEEQFQEFLKLKSNKISTK